MPALCLEVPGLPEARREVGELQEGLPVPLEVTVVCLWQGQVGDGLQRLQEHRQ